MGLVESQWDCLESQWGRLSVGMLQGVDSRPNSCCQQNLKCFDMPLLSLGLFS